MFQSPSKTTLTLLLTTDSTSATTAVAKDFENDTNINFQVSWLSFYYISLYMNTSSDAKPFTFKIAFSVQTYIHFRMMASSFALSLE